MLATSSFLKVLSLHHSALHLFIADLQRSSLDDPNQRTDCLTSECIALRIIFIWHQLFFVFVVIKYKKLQFSNRADMGLLNMPSNKALTLVLFRSIRKRKAFENTTSLSLSLSLSKLQSHV